MSQPKDQRRFLLTVLFAGWVMAFAYSFYGFVAAVLGLGGDGMSGSLNSGTHFLGWQSIAGVFACAVFGVSRAWPVGSGVRRMGLGPFVVMLLMLSLLFGTLVLNA